MIHGQSDYFDDIIPMVCDVMDNINQGTLPTASYLRFVDVDDSRIRCTKVLENHISLKRRLSSMALQSIGKSSTIETILFHVAILFTRVIHKRVIPRALFRRTVEIL